MQARLCAQETAEQKQAREERKAEHEETNSYRHSPTVQWVSNATGLDIETTAKGFEFVNFGVIFLAIGYSLVKTVPKMLRKRSEKLSEELETARKATTDANERLSAVEAKLAGLDAEIAKIRQQVEEEMKQDEARIKSSIVEESARIVDSAEQEIVVAGAQARRELKQYATELAIDRALANLTLTPEMDRELIAEFSRDSATDTIGGRN